MHFPFGIEGVPKDLTDIVLNALERNGVVASLDDDLLQTARALIADTLAELV